MVGIANVYMDTIFAFLSMFKSLVGPAAESGEQSPDLPLAGQDASPPRHRGDNYWGIRTRLSPPFSTLHHVPSSWPGG